MNFNENNLWREKTELLYLRLSKLAKAMVLLKMEFDTEDQVLLRFIIIKQAIMIILSVYILIPI